MAALVFAVACGAPGAPETAAAPNPHSSLAHGELPQASGPKPPPVVVGEPMVPLVPASFTPAPSAPAEARSCQQIEADYAALTAQTSCRVDAECQVVSGQCSVGLGGCSHAVHVSVSDGAVRALGQEYDDADCGGGVCRCASPASAARCVAGTCQPVRTSRPTAPRPAPPRPTPPRPAPMMCPPLACAMPDGCFEVARDANGCPTCRCAEGASLRPR